MMTKNLANHLLVDLSQNRRTILAQVTSLQEEARKLEIKPQLPFQTVTWALGATTATLKIRVIEIIGAIWKMAGSAQQLFAR